MLYKLSKVFFVIFVYYIIWFQRAFFQISGLPFILGMLMIGCMLTHKLLLYRSVELVILSPLIWWLVFAVFIFSTGYFIAADRFLLIDSVISYIQTLIMMIYIIDVSAQEKSVDFFIKVLIILGLIMSINLIFFGYDRYGQIMISELSNPNSDGLTVLFCLSALLLITKVKMDWKLLISILLIFLFSYAVILTSSRKSFASVIFMVVVWYFLVFRDYMRKYSFGKRLFIIFGVLTLFGVVIINFFPIFLDSHLYYRLTEGVGYEGDELRLLMYKTAYENFRSHPLIGIGYNQFRVYFGTYSHSTYAEIISNSGIIGTILYFVPYGIIVLKLMQVVLYSKDVIVSNQAKLFLILMVLLVILGFGVIHFYGITFNILFSLMIAFYHNELNNILELQQVSEVKNVNHDNIDGFYEHEVIDAKN